MMMQLEASFGWRTQGGRSQLNQEKQEFGEGCCWSRESAEVLGSEQFGEGCCWFRGSGEVSGTGGT